jgi:phosphoglycerate dehydrogenase-like enzyme
MPAVTLLALARPTDPRLRLLERLPEETRIAAGDCAEAFRDAAPHADVILSWFTPRALLEEVFAAAPRVRWMHSGAAGVEHVLFPALVESPVLLTNSRGVFSSSLAEFVIGVVMFFAKDYRRMVRSQQQGVWDCFDVEEAEGKTLGIVGYGDIGSTVAQRARAFGMKIEALRRRPELSREDPLVEAVHPVAGLRELLARSDYVLVTAPLTAETRGLIGEAELRVMKPSAVLINIGRGPVVVEQALLRALEERWIRGAALDVYEKEPLPEGHPFYRLENVLLSAHCADHTPGWMDRAMELFLENFERFRRGEPLRNIIDKHSGY